MKDAKNHSWKNCGFFRWMRCGLGHLIAPSPSGISVSKCVSTANKIIWPMFYCCLFLIADFSFLYNPLIYSNTLFWPSSLLFPYQTGTIPAPMSPNLGNVRDYTLTPEKDDSTGKCLVEYCGFHPAGHSQIENDFHFLPFLSLSLDGEIRVEPDEDEPLNLSTRQRSPTPEAKPSMSTSANNQTRSNVMIWSPASICERESAENHSSRDAESPRDSDDMHTDVKSNKSSQQYQNASGIQITSAPLTSSSS